MLPMTHDRDACCPEPRDLSDVHLPPALDELVESLAAHVHAVWAQARWRDGWRYGEQKDAGKKLTPCMLPYEELPETEKSYDRQTALGTLRFLLSEGWTLAAPEGALAALPAELSLPSGHVSVRKLSVLWEAAHPFRDVLPGDWFVQFSRAALNAGVPALAFDAAQDGLAVLAHRSHVDASRAELKLLFARAAAELHAWVAARQVLEELIADGSGDDDTRGILAKTYKEEAFLLSVGPARDALLAKSLAIYETAYLAAELDYRETGDRAAARVAYYNGINVATMQHLLGGSDPHVLSRVETVCRELESEGDFWLQATLGELALLRSASFEAVSHYRAALAHPDCSLRDRSSIRRQVERLGEAGVDVAAVRDIFPVAKYLILELPEGPLMKSGSRSMFMDTWVRQQGSIGSSHCG